MNERIAFGFLLVPKEQLGWISSESGPNGLVTISRLQDFF